MVPQEAPTSILKSKLKLEYGVGDDGKEAVKIVKSGQLLAEVHHQSALLFSLPQGRHSNFFNTPWNRREVIAKHVVRANAGARK